MEYFFTCPYCWQEISVIIEPSENNKTYSFIEDCEVCCNPINIKLNSEGNAVISFEAEKIQ